MAVRFASGSLTGRAVATAVLAIALTATGLQAAAPESPPAHEANAATALPTDAPGVPGVASGPMASLSTAVPADPGYADEVMALGLDEATAAFMAWTLSTVDVIDAHTFVVHHAFPNGATGDETYHLVQSTGMDPGDPPTIVYEIMGDELHYQLRYAVDSAGLPEDLRDQVLPGLPPVAVTSSSATAGPVRLLGLAPVGPLRGVFAADARGTVDVVVDGVISQGRSTAVGKFVEFGKERGFTKSANSYKAIKTGLKIWDAVQTNDLIASALDKLKALRECAENPTNPVTQKQYERTPNSSRRSSRS